jgi:hypothetical protein
LFIYLCLGSLSFSSSCVASAGIGNFIIISAYSLLSVITLTSFNYPYSLVSIDDLSGISRNNSDNEVLDLRIFLCPLHVKENDNNICDEGCYAYYEV